MSIAEIKERIEEIIGDQQPQEVEELELEGVEFGKFTPEIKAELGIP